MLCAIFIFVRISQSFIMCFITTIQQGVWQDFIKTAAQKKSETSFKAEFLVPNTSSRAVSHDNEGNRLFFIKCPATK